MPHKQRNAAEGHLIDYVTHPYECTMLPSMTTLIPYRMIANNHHSAMHQFIHLLYYTLYYNYKFKIIMENVVEQKMFFAKFILHSNKESHGDHTHAEHLFGRYLLLFMTIDARLQQP